MEVTYLGSKSEEKRQVVNHEIRVDAFSKEYSWLKDPKYLSSLKYFKSDCYFDIPRLVGLSGMSL